MKSLDQFLTSNKAAILLAGPPGSGKTTTASQLVDYIIECDNNIKGPVNFVRQHKLKADWKYDIPLYKENGTTVPRQDRFREVARLVDEAKKAGIKKIALSSLTTFVDMVLDEVRRQQGRRIGNGITTFDEPMQIQDWGAFAALMKHVVITLKTDFDLCIFCCHVETKDDINDDSKTPRLLQYIACPGQLRETIAGYFDEVWLLESEEATVNGKVESVRYLRTLPSSSKMAALGLKTAVGLGRRVKLDFNEITNALAK